MIFKIQAECIPLGYLFSSRLEYYLSIKHWMCFRSWIWPRPSQTSEKPPWKRLVTKDLRAWIIGNCVQSCFTNHNMSFSPWFFQSTCILPEVVHLCWAIQNSHWCLGIWCRISSRVAWPFHTLLDSVPTWGSLGLILQSKLFGSANTLRNLLWFSLKELLIAVSEWFNPLSTWDFRS